MDYRTAQRCFGPHRDSATVFADPSADLMNSIVARPPQRRILGLVVLVVIAGLLTGVAMAVGVIVLSPIPSATPLASVSVGHVPVPAPGAGVQAGQLRRAIDGLGRRPAPGA
jgi:hypothetical protein